MGQIFSVPFGDYMDYTEALDYYVKTPAFLSNSGNDALLTLLEYLGDPQDKLKYIHVAGTNGKGSVCVMLAKAYEKAGYRTGLYTSPYIDVFNERIRINGENISDDELVSYTERIKSAIEKLHIELTAFAKITACAFLYFCEKKCDIVILETGLGGRLDATNVIKRPILSIITKIGLDHTEYLGNTLTEIASEKCGIIKNGVPVLTTKAQNTEALSEIEKNAKKKGSRLLLAEKSCELPLGLQGEYQKQNAAIAEKALDFLGFDKDIIKEAFKESTNPARFEFLSDNLLIDGAHNPDGISALLESLKSLSRPVRFVIAMMRDKNYAESARLIYGSGARITVTQLDNPRCLSANELLKCFPNAEIDENYESAVTKALQNISENEIVCVAGSLYLASAVRRKFIKRF